MAYPGDTGKVRIGKYRSILDGLRNFLGDNQRTDWVSSYPLRTVRGLPGALADGHAPSKGEITVGNDVWRRAEALVRSGVTVGDGAAIGMGAVVAADVRPYAIVSGNPARETQRRFPDDLEPLQRIAWWDWPEDVVLESLDDLCDPDVEAFVRLSGQA